MSRDAKLSAVLHLILHLAEAEKPMTSEQLAAANRTNPVVIRQQLAGLRVAGLVRSEKGHGGGWTLNRPLKEATLGDVYRALGAPTLIALRHLSDNPECLVQKSVNAALDDSYQAAEALLTTRFDQVTLADIAQDVRQRFADAGLDSGAYSHAV